jgi:DNA-binding transcriptional MerR regulator
VVAATGKSGWTLDELVDQAKRLLDRLGIEAGDRDGRVLSVPDARTVRYYATLGLVDRPDIVAREARYGRRQSLQLAAIKALQSQGLPLADVQKRLYAKTDEELNALLQASAATLKQRPRREASILWREFILEPGLRLQAATDWTPGSADALRTRFEAALSALTGPETQPEPGASS